MELPRFLSGPIEAIIAAVGALMMSISPVSLPINISLGTPVAPAAQVNHGVGRDQSVIDKETTDNGSATVKVSVPAHISVPPSTPTDKAQVYCGACSAADPMPADGDGTYGCAKPGCYNCPPCTYSTIEGRKLMMCPMIACRAIDDDTGVVPTM